MHQPHTILIVHDDAKVLERLALQLKNAAEVTTATSFEQAKVILATAPPTVLIAALRLGQYNGLHLIIRSRIDHPRTTAFILSDRVDAALEQEAAKYGATCVSYPGNEATLLSLVSEALAKSDV